MKKIMPILVVISFIVLIMGLLMYENDGNILDAQEVKAIVIETDNSEVIQAGIAPIGFQKMNVEIIEDKFKGERVEALNQLLGELEYDNFYKAGDKVIIAIKEENNEIVAAKAIELYRQDWQIILFSLFVFSLIVYARFIGLKALLSFVASLYVIWKFLIPGLLAGKEPLLLTFFVLTLLTAVIMFSVAGFTKKGVAAFVGTMFGLFVTIAITLFFGEKFGLMGMTMPFAQTLIFSGHFDLNIQHIFYASIIIGASGAAMDIAMDVAASMEEIKTKKTDIKTRELIQSGFNIGRAVIGTMTTTLLLAYSGGYLTLLMLFMTKNSSFIRIINLKIVTAEIMRTLIGSMGLVLVAPITAVFAGLILSVDFEKAFNKKEIKKFLSKNNRVTLKQ